MAPMVAVRVQMQTSDSPTADCADRGMLSAIATMSGGCGLATKLLVGRLLALFGRKGRDCKSLSNSESISDAI